MRTSVFSCFVLLLALGAEPASAQVQIFVEDFVGWAIANSGPTTLIDFETLPDGTPSSAGIPITPDFNYTDQGVTFSPPFPVDFFGIAGSPASGFDLRTWMNNPFERAWIVAHPVVLTPAIGVFFPGGTTVSIFDAQGGLIADQSFSAPLGPHFIGFVSDIPIARVTVDRGGNAEGIDAFVFNPTPEPTSALLFGATALVGILKPPRRRL